MYPEMAGLRIVIPRSGLVKVRVFVELQGNSYNRCGRSGGLGLVCACWLRDRSQHVAKICTARALEYL